MERLEQRVCHWGGQVIVHMNVTATPVKGGTTVTMHSGDDTLNWGDGTPDGMKVVGIGTADVVINYSGDGTPLIDEGTGWTHVTVTPVNCGTTTTLNWGDGTPNGMKVVGIGTANVNGSDGVVTLDCDGTLVGDQSTGCTYLTGTPTATATIDWGDGTPIINQGTDWTCVTPTLSMFTAAIYWSDGMPSSKLIIDEGTGWTHVTVTPVNCGTTATINSGDGTANGVMAVGIGTADVVIINYSGDGTPIIDQGMTPTLITFTMTINWGDGTPIDAQGTGCTYVTPTLITMAAVLDAELSGPVVNNSVAEGATFSDVDTTVTDADPNGMLGDYLVTINWGDGVHNDVTATPVNGGTTTTINCDGTPIVNISSYPQAATIVLGDGRVPDGHLLRRALIGTEHPMFNETLLLAA